MIRSRHSVTVIDPDEERVVHVYHESLSYQAEEAEDRLQAPRIGATEAAAEVHHALIASVMVGGPV